MSNKFVLLYKDILVSRRRRNDILIYHSGVPFNPLIPEVQYKTELNIMAFPLLLFQFPFYEVGYPKSFYYGAICPLLARAIMRSLGEIYYNKNTRSYHNRYGKYNDTYFFTLISAAENKHNRECFVDSSYKFVVCETMFFDE
ncbi:hypothetical protein Y032_0236g3229 [Ancylostoma ceylanicum]|nr:hypothetical protein Y032_0236g3229 [Ancylostoma ceylanicum]